MKTYRIIAETNSWIAARDGQFNGKTNIVVESGLSLKEAHRMLLDMYNTKYESERPYAANWGMAVWVFTEIPGNPYFKVVYLCSKCANMERGSSI